MNAISDLTARAISFITAVQTTLLNGEIDIEKETDRVSILTIAPGDFESKFRSLIYNNKLEDKFSVRAAEIVWISSKMLNKPQAIEYTIKICIELIKWINDNRTNGISLLQESYGGYPTPYNWRISIGKILYAHPGERVRLAIALQYLPIQIILALGGGGYDAAAQRILQMWTTNHEDKVLLLNDEEIKISEKFTGLEKASGINAEKLLQNHALLLDHLIIQKAPLSFELVFSEELKEIEANRIRRVEEEYITGLHEPSVKDPKAKDEEMAKVKDINDPFEKVRKMNVCALAFSGGGIRSATFNLGILQGLAGKKLIGKFDYLSTVSGGGYIGSWLAAWIKRDESVVKVSNRLCPHKSPDPAGEELKPIKWLRMFSNYFAPNASIMSVDSWTVGMTWLRNTLLNQIVIFLLLLSVLFAGNLLYLFWSGHLIHNLYTSWPEVLGWSFLLLTPVALLAGLGMYAYHKENFRRINIRRKNTNKISMAIIAIAIIGAYIISAWLSSSYYKKGVSLTSIYDKIIFFAPAAVVAFGCLYFVAVLGKYMDCIRKFQSNNIKALFILFSITLFSAIFGLICLALVSVLLGNMPNISIGSILLNKKVLQFIFGVPLTLEVFSFTVIARMGLLGKYFPDERREWWGRIGAHIHRISFLWILVSASALLGWDFLQYAFHKWAAPSIAATGGWIALVGTCVKAAFSSKTAGKGNEKGFYPTLLNILSNVGPYLFILGLLILLPALTDPLLLLVNRVFIDLGYALPGEEIQNLLIMIFCAAAAYLLARQLGVNEFSMYNFYRNRLVRGYLGGTRRTTDRQQTANPFTGFDILDDEKLYKFSNEFGYHGPYPVLNCALNASQGQDLDRQDRKAESFIFSPLFCGFDFSKARSSADKIKSYDYAYRQTKQYAFKDEGPTIGTAMAISGAAVNPNQGYHSSPPIAFLLTIFNAQMGRWLGNPRKNSWQYSDPTSGLGYIISDLVNKTSTRDNFVALSDGGHFDNMGLYEMVRRKCPYIILCDAEQDGEFTCEGLANAIRRCRIDFGAEIKIDISKITDRPDGRHSKAHYALGEITYVGDNQTAILLYIKSSIDGNEPVDVYEYALKNKTFPHQTTADQFFDEEQFESYRKLGLHIADTVLSDKNVISALKFNYKAKSDEETLEIIEKPFISFFNMIKNFFAEKDK